jgi:hypothetical protein
LKGFSLFDGAESGFVFDCVGVLCNNVDEPLGLNFPDAVDFPPLKP